MGTGIGCLAIRKRRGARVIPRFPLGLAGLSGKALAPRERQEVAEIYPRSVSMLVDKYLRGTRSPASQAHLRLPLDPALRNDC
jgi:hypothetical protein